MLKKSDAHSLVESYLKKTLGGRIQDVVIQDSETLENPRGWIFFYQRRLYLETKKIRNALIGNGPIFIDKFNGKVVQFGSSGSVDYWYDLYDRGCTREDVNGVVHCLYREDLRKRRKP